MSICWEIWILQTFPDSKGHISNLKIVEAWVAIFTFNVPARTMKRERFPLAGVPLLTSHLLVMFPQKQILSLSDLSYPNVLPCLTSRFTVSPDAPMSHQALCWLTGCLRVPPGFEMSHWTHLCLIRLCTVTPGALMSHLMLLCLTRRSNVSSDAPLFHQASY